MGYYWGHAQTKKGLYLRIVPIVEAQLCDVRPLRLI